MERAGLRSRTAACCRGTIKMIRLHFWRILMPSIFPRRGCSGEVEFIAALGSQREDEGPDRDDRSGSSREWEGRGGGRTVGFIDLKPSTWHFNWTWAAAAGNKHRGREEGVWWAAEVSARTEKEGGTVAGVGAVTVLKCLCGSRRPLKFSIGIKRIPREHTLILDLRTVPYSHI